MPEDTTLADLLAFVLAGRPERLTSAAVDQMPPEQKAGVGLVTDTIAALAGADEPEKPSGGPARSHPRKRSGPAGGASAARSSGLRHDRRSPHARAPARGTARARHRPGRRRRLDEARAEGVPVVYVLDRHAPDDPELEEWTSHAVEGTPGAEVWPPLAPQAGRTAS